MNHELADGAHDRLDAQIAEALFGQPGMSKMDVANRVRELRGDGPALLADMQPGGRVRLGDGQSQCKGCGRRTFHNFPQGDICLHCKLISDECRSTERVALDALVAAGHVDQARVDQALKVAAALSAQPSPATCKECLQVQPSPGGQGESISISDDDRAVLQRLQDALPTAGINGWAKGVEVLERLLRDSLAARQPVGEPVDAIERVARLLYLRSCNRQADGAPTHEWEPMDERLKDYYRKDARNYEALRNTALWPAGRDNYTTTPEGGSQ